VAAELKAIGGLDVETVNGGKGEFTVLVDGQEVARKTTQVPTAEQAVAAVKDSLAKQSVP